MKKQKLILKELKLSKGEFQEYYLDKNSKAEFAQYRGKEKKICVNSNFEKLHIKEKISILYHERGHSHFYLFKLFNNLSGIFLLLSVIFLFSSIILFLISLIPNSNTFNPLWIIALLITFFFFISFVSIKYLLEIIADIYSASKTNSNVLAKILKREYSKNSKKSWWDKYVLHPPPSLREKIVNLILKFNNKK